MSEQVVLYDALFLPRSLACSQWCKLDHTASKNYFQKAAMPLSPQWWHPQTSHLWKLGADYNLKISTLFFTHSKHCVIYAEQFYSLLHVGVYL